MKASTYLHFNGNCKEAINFYKDILGGKITTEMYFKDAPKEVFVAPDFAQDWIMHCTLQAENVTIMASDFLNDKENFNAGNNFAISISTTDEAQAVAMFTGLSKSGNVVMPFEATFWGGKFGMLKDKYGVNWMISLEENQV